MASLILPAPAPEDAPPDPGDTLSALTAERVREAISIASALAPRSQQARLGPSELGMSCDRALAHRVTGTVPSGQSKSDPLAALVGTGVHLVMAECFRRLAGRTGRYLIEHRVTYRGVTGSVDLYDRHHRMAVDWKSTTKAKIRRVRRDGPPFRYLVQAHTYAAGLIDAGEPVEYVAIVYVPVDGTLDDVHVIVRPFDRAITDRAIDRYEAIARDAAERGPAALPARTSALCGWCPWLRPNRPADAHGCPGQSALSEVEGNKSNG